MSAVAFATDEEAAAIADEADIIIRSLKSRVGKMEKSDASALNSVHYRLAWTPVACHIVIILVQTWHISDAARLANSAAL